MNINLKRDILCSSCDGSGASSKQNIITCSSCDGSGITIKIQQLGPGFMSQSRAKCNACNGNGKKILELCTNCNGAKIISTKSGIKLPISQNMKNGEQIIFEGFANHNPDADIQGDLIIQLNETKHPNFTRKHNDLHLKLDILLSQALCGGAVEFTHLDDRKLYIELTDIINPNMKKVIHNEGMYHSGDLIIEFNIIMPDILSNEYKKYLYKLLPKQADIDTSNHTILNYSKYIEPQFTETQQNKKKARGGGGIPENVQCAQQ